MTKFLLIGFGGFIGAILRYILSGAAQSASGSISFPFGTLVVNILGCFLIGSLVYLIEARAMFTAELRTFLLIGVLGAFTTYSTFGSETHQLILESKFHLAVINIGSHIILGLFAVYLGRMAGYLIWR